MQKKYALYGAAFLLFLTGLFSCFHSGGTGKVLPPSPGYVLSVSNAEGVAPLLVHFEALCSDLNFHSSEFLWDFADSSAPLWGSTGINSNTAKGPVTAHVFQNPGTYNVEVTIRERGRTARVLTVSVRVLDPLLVYPGESTICVNQTGDTDFTGAPSGSRQIATNDLSSIAPLAVSGTRILFKRGSSWNTGSLSWPENDGPVTISAYGSGIGADEYGIYSNAPHIEVTGNATFLNLERKKNWRLMDIRFSNPSKTGTVVGGSMLMQRHLLYRLRATGFGTSVGWSHWLDPLGPQIDTMGVVSCVLTDAGDHLAYVGAERLVLLGNRFENADLSHVVRVWQAYRSLIAHNSISGSSINSADGRQALKLHGPSQSQVFSTAWDRLRNRTEYTVISDNVFGSSGPWPVSIGPQDDWKDERLSNLIFERNRYCADYGEHSVSSIPLDTIFLFKGRNFTIRNNVIDGAHFGNYFTGIAVRAATVGPQTAFIRVLNNTIYKPDLIDERLGIRIDAGVLTSEVYNNLAVFTGTGGIIVTDRGIGTKQITNLLNSGVSFVDPDTVLFPLLRSFALTAESTAAIGSGTYTRYVFDDFTGNSRSPDVRPDIGAYKYFP